MVLNKKIISCESGATLILVVLMATVILSVMALAVDMGRLYAVQSKVQNANDAALMGAVATANSCGNPDVSVVKECVTTEARKLFNANYPDHYMGSSVTLSGVDITSVNTDGAQGTQYSMSASVTAPTTIMNNMFGKENTVFNVLSKVYVGISGRNQLELALVLDNTGSMGNTLGGGTSKIQALRTASADLTNILFGAASSNNYLHISVIPFDTDVNIGSGHSGWIQTTSQARYTSYTTQAGHSGTYGFAANRNPDNPPSVAYNDFTDAPPTTDQTRFRVPPYTSSNTPNIYGPINGSNWCCGYPDFSTLSLSPMKFGMSVKSDVLTTVSQMQASGNTRINVGLMWGWFTLSEKWQGLWGVPGLPADPNAALSKQMVLMTDGLNTVWGTWYGNATSNDDATTSTLCETIKSKGITLYVIGLGRPGDINETILRNCASRPTYYFLAPTTSQLQTVFHTIGDQILYNTLHLNQ